MLTKTKVTINERAIVRFLVRLVVAIALVVLSAVIWFIIGECVPALRAHMPNFYNFVDGILTGFDDLYAFLPKF